MNKGHLSSPVGGVVILISLLSSPSVCSSFLSPGISDSVTYREIVVHQQPGIAEQYNELNTEERVMAYLLHRALMPVNNMFADQMHRNAKNIMTLFKDMYRQQDVVRLQLGETFIEQVKMYLIYIATNHCHYFRKTDERKRTPNSLQLNQLTPDSVRRALALIKSRITFATYESLVPAIFHDASEARLTEPDIISLSAVNFHSRSFNDSMYLMIDPLDRHINSYFSVNENGTPHVTPMKIGGHFSKELEVATHWLKHALNYAQAHTSIFDHDFIMSLDYLIKFLTGGDEVNFKNYFKHWISTSSRLDFHLGPVEVYEDPMQVVGSWQGDLSIKNINNQNLRQILSVIGTIEQQLPVMEEYKRKAHDANGLHASFNTPLYTVGALGPLAITYAYNLPNYQDIKDSHGSRSIVYYPADQRMAQIYGPQDWYDFYYTPEQREWLRTYDPTGRILNEIRELLYCLHESIGHASGSSHVHEVAPNDPILNNLRYSLFRVGDTITINHLNRHNFIKNANLAEELRAEAIALYVATHHLPEILGSGFLAEWAQAHSQETLVKWIFQVMAYKGLERLEEVDPVEYETDECEDGTYTTTIVPPVISGAHKQMNVIITNYLIAKGAITMQTETIEKNGLMYDIMTIDVVDLDKARAASKELMQLAQCIISTGDGAAADELENNYGQTLGTPMTTMIMQRIRRELLDYRAVHASVFPHLKPIINSDGMLIDAEAEWPADIFEQIMREDELMYSLELS